MSSDESVEEKFLNILYYGLTLGIIVFIVLFVFTVMMINKYGDKLYKELGFNKSSDLSINKVNKFGNKFYYSAASQVTDTDKAVKLLEEIEDELKLYFGLYITFSIIFFGFFLLVFIHSMYRVFGEHQIQYLFLLAIIIVFIVFSILFMININKGMNDIPNFIDNEIKKNNKNKNTSS